MENGLTSGSSFLTNAAKSYIVTQYQNPSVRVSAPVDPKLGYTPTLQFKVHAHLTVIVEVSESPYPAILALRRTDIEDLQIPIAVYCVCPEEAYVANQPEAKRLMKHGFGLLTVSADGQVQRRAVAIPLIQRIAQEEFLNEVVSLPPVIRRRLAETYEKYINSAAAGVADVAEVVEGLILTAGRDAAKKTWIPAASARPGQPARTLDALQLATQFGNALAAIGSARGYVSEVRNNSHHFPKNPAQAARKYRECRHSFIVGLKCIVAFRNAMKQAGLTGGLK